MTLLDRILSLPSEAWEKIIAIPPLTVFLTSVFGVVNWQTVFYVVSTFWVVIQTYFRLRKEYAKWKAKQYLDPDDTDYKAPI